MDNREITTLIPRALIRFYQMLTTGRGPHCRFAPSCSHYMYDALKTTGLLKGLRLGTLRILKCHPWHPGGYDPLSL